MAHSNPESAPREKRRLQLQPREADAPLTVRELAARHRVCTKTIGRWVKAGVPHMRAGYVLRFYAAEVESWLRTRPLPSPRRRRGEEVQAA